MIAPEGQVVVASCLGVQNCKTYRFGVQLDSGLAVARLPRKTRPTGTASRVEQRFESVYGKRFCEMKNRRDFPFIIFQFSFKANPECYAVLVNKTVSSTI